MKNVKGRIEYRDLNMGFWVLAAEDGAIYELLAPPSQIQIDGQRLSLWLEVQEVGTINMGGIPAQVAGFEVLD